MLRYLQRTDFSISAESLELHLPEKQAGWLAGWLLGRRRCLLSLQIFCLIQGH